jgi:hypothetical protein
LTPFWAGGGTKFLSDPPLLFNILECALSSSVISLLNPCNYEKEHVMNASDILKYGDSFLKTTLDGVPESEWESR